MTVSEITLKLKANLFFLQLVRISRKKTDMAGAQMNIITSKKFTDFFNFWEIHMQAGNNLVSKDPNVPVKPYLQLNETRQLL